LPSKGHPQIGTTRPSARIDPASNRHLEPEKGYFGDGTSIGFHCHFVIQNANGDKNDRFSFSPFLPFSPFRGEITCFYENRMQTIFITFLYAFCALGGSA
jgi:hypothetical protein